VSEARTEIQALKTNVDRQSWVDALHKKHADFEDKNTEYWTSRISRDSANPAKLWQSMSQLLRSQKQQRLAAGHTSHRRHVSEVLQRQSAGCSIRHGKCTSTCHQAND